MLLTQFPRLDVVRKGKVSLAGDNRRCIRDNLCNPCSEAPGIQAPGKVHPPTELTRFFSGIQYHDEDIQFFNLIYEIKTETDFIRRCKR